MKIDRREFIRNLCFLGLATWLIKPFNWISEVFAKEPPSKPAGKIVADPSKGQAKNMKYVHYTNEYVGPKKDIFTKAKATCLNCNYYKPDKAGDEWGKCAMVANNYVYKDGLCQMWMKKPGT